VVEEHAGVEEHPRRRDF